MGDMNRLIDSISDTDKKLIRNFDATSSTSDLEIVTDCRMFGSSFSLLFKKKKKLRFLKVFIKRGINLAPGALNFKHPSDLPCEIRLIEEDYFNQFYNKDMVLKTEFYSEEYL